MADEADALVVDPREGKLEALDDFCDAVAEPLALLGRSGRSPDARPEAAARAVPTTTSGRHRIPAGPATAQGSFGTGAADGRHPTRRYVLAARAGLDLN